MKLIIDVIVPSIIESQNMTKVSTIDIGERRKGHVDIALCFKK
jgi:hypothetical protein